MIKRFCVECGTEFEADSKLARYCPECVEKHKAEQKAKQKEYAKARTAKLGLVNVTIYKEDKATLQEFAKNKGVTLAEALKEIVASVDFEALTETTEEE